MAALSVTYVFLAAVLVAATAQDCPVYVPDENGIIRMDAEQRGPGGGWEFQEELKGYGGSGYLTYKPWSSYGGVEQKPTNFSNSRIKAYYFKVHREGTYRVVVRSAAPHGTEHNDMFMSLPESGATRIQNGRQSDLSYGLSSYQINDDWVDGQTWFKVYQNRGDNHWHDGGVTKDHDGHSILSRTLYPDGTWYSVRISGRSTQYKVDRIIVYHCLNSECDTGSAKYWQAVGGIDGPQSQCEGGTAPNAPMPAEEGPSSEEQPSSDNGGMFEEGNGASDVSAGQRGRSSLMMGPPPTPAPAPAPAPAPTPAPAPMPNSNPLPNIFRRLQRTAVVAPSKL